MATRVVDAVPIEAVADCGASGDSIRMPLGRVVGARSGDKGGNANLGLFVRTSQAYPWQAYPCMRDFMTVERLRELLPEADGLTIERYEFANLRAIDLVIVGLLGEGVAASTRIDAQAKGLGEYVRSRIVDIPVELTPS